MKALEGILKLCGPNAMFQRRIKMSARPLATTSATRLRPTTKHRSLQRRCLWLGIEQDQHEHPLRFLHRSILAFSLELLRREEAIEFQLHASMER